MNAWRTDRPTILCFFYTGVQRMMCSFRANSRSCPIAHSWYNTTDPSNYSYPLVFLVSLLPLQSKVPTVRPKISSTYFWHKSIRFTNEHQQQIDNPRSVDPLHPDETSKNHKIQDVRISQQSCRCRAQGDCSGISQPLWLSSLPDWKECIPRNRPQPATPTEGLC